MTGLYHVVSPIELFSPKCHVPLVSMRLFSFPLLVRKNVYIAIANLEELIFYLDDPNHVFSQLADPTKPPLFSVASLDRMLLNSVAPYGLSKIKLMAFTLIPLTMTRLLPS